MSEPPLLLCSRSPRRAALLGRAGIAFRLGPAPDVDETPPRGVDPARAAQAIAERKARAVLPHATEVPVLAADTLVYLPDSRMLGKPKSPSDARRMLTLLSGKRHRVATGVAVGRGCVLLGGVAVTEVTFRRLDAAEIDAYVASGEPLDKAGAYAIQGGAADFVERLDGEQDTVVGLPIGLVRNLLARLEDPEG